MGVSFPSIIFFCRSPSLAYLLQPSVPHPPPSLSYFSPGQWPSWQLCCFSIFKCYPVPYWKNPTLNAVLIGSPLIPIRSLFVIVPVTWKQEFLGLNFGICHHHVGLSPPLHLPTQALALNRLVSKPTSFWSSDCRVAKHWWSFTLLSAQSLYM